LIELPIKIKNSGHLAGFIRCLQDSHKAELDCSFDSLSMASASTTVEKHLELINSWTDDVVSEQHRFQQHSKSVPNQDKNKYVG